MESGCSSTSGGQLRWFRPLITTPPSERFLSKRELFTMEGGLFILIFIFGLKSPWEEEEVESVTVERDVWVFSPYTTQLLIGKRKQID